MEEETVTYTLAASKIIERTRKNRADAARAAKFPRIGTPKDRGDAIIVISRVRGRSRAHLPRMRCREKTRGGEGACAPDMPDRGQRFTFSLRRTVSFAFLFGLALAFARVARRRVTEP